MKLSPQARVAALAANADAAVADEVAPVIEHALALDPATAVIGASSLGGDDRAQDAETDGCGSGAAIAATATRLGRHRGAKIATNK